MLDKLGQIVEIGDIITHFSQGGIYFGLVVSVQSTVIKYKLVRQMLDRSFVMTNNTSTYSVLNSQLVLNITKSSIIDFSVDGKTSIRSAVDRFINASSK